MTTEATFELVSDFTPAGDQPKAIEQLVRGIQAGQRAQTLLGVTGSGKTFTMANVIQQLQRPTLVVSHNKTLAAQLYEEFCDLFPNNAVSYFVSYYDYYQPEAYIPQRDIYIEKDASRNDDLDRLRLAATAHLSRRKDVIVVASVSSIFGLGSPANYQNKMLVINVGDLIDRQELLHRLNDLQYARADIEFKRSTYRVRGDVVEIHPSYEQFAYRVELFGDEVERLSMIHAVSGEVLSTDQMIAIYPAVHYVMPEDQLATAVTQIRDELDQQVMHLRHEGKMLEAQRLLARTKYDIEMIQEVGHCAGIENYSRYLDGRAPGERPYTLLDYFPDPWLMMIDESHVTLPQIRAMHHGDQQRKKVLVEHGFRLPSALDNRPLTFEEFESSIDPVVYVSATPGPYELEDSGGEIIEQVIRPTGLLDPEIDIRSASGQVADLHERIKVTVGEGHRVLVNTLTKRLAEDLAVYFEQQGVRARYLHSEIKTLDRVSTLKALREGEFDVLIGVNLLREGLDLPEVALVAIMDADKRGFLRSETSLIQQMGRAARHAGAKVILYADEITDAMRRAIDETDRRRVIQQAYNEKHNITPVTVTKSVRDHLSLALRARKRAQEALVEDASVYDLEQQVADLQTEMIAAAEALAFEKAAAIRDQIAELKERIDQAADEPIE